MPLYDPAAALKMAPLRDAVKRRVAERRTCPLCGVVRKEIVRGGQCLVCQRQAQRQRARERARTCGGCGVVRERPYPAEHRRCQGCRRTQLAEKRARVDAWLAEVTVCVGDGCAVKLGSKVRARAWLKGQGRAWLLRPERPDLPDASWWPDWSRRCSSCAEEYERRQAEQRAEYQARYERERAERRARKRREAEDRRRWAAAALADPGVVVLDTETTGLHADARIVEIAVISASGAVVLDSLINPGVPIPAAATAIHGIGDADVASAPTFGELLVELTVALDGRRCLVYNASYDIDRLRHELALHYTDRAARAEAGVDEETSGGSVPEGPEDARKRARAEGRAQATAWLDAMRFEDVMEPYAAWYGEWDDYHGNYRWQPLNGGHRAAGDCRALLERLKEMANGKGTTFTPTRLRDTSVNPGDR
ncbi:3'-5' exonuclease, partial [Streptomyces celluloflavus]|uniref:3'-5' exonuclease n=1 Tax=Streptomyces celluloflavus TaxID=58344 RepID=UPI0036B6368B